MCRGSQARNHSIERWPKKVLQSVSTLCYYWLTMIPGNRSYFFTYSYWPIHLGGRRTAL